MALSCTSTWGTCHLSGAARPSAGAFFQRNDGLLFPGFRSAMNSIASHLLCMQGVNDVWNTTQVALASFSSHDFRHVSLFGATHVSGCNPGEGSNMIKYGCSVTKNVVSWQLCSMIHVNMSS